MAQNPKYTPEEMTKAAVKPEMLQQCIDSIYDALLSCLEMPNPRLVGMCLYNSFIQPSTRIIIVLSLR